jgi:nitric oxide reductase NorD protein
MAILAKLLGRKPAAPPEPTARLDDVRRRLELLLAAMYGHAIPVAAAEPPSDPGWLGSLFAAVPKHMRGAPAAASTDGERILLPPELPLGEGDDAPARFRVLAVAQAERLARGTPALAPGGEFPIQHDLYHLIESATVDQAIARAAPGLARTLAAERADALARRPPLEALTPVEREVETVVRALLAADPAEPPPELAASASPAESRRRAREMAKTVRAAKGEYRGVPTVAAWGALPRSNAPVLVSRLRQYAPQFVTTARWASSTSIANVDDGRAQEANRDVDVDFDAQGNAPGEKEAMPWYKNPGGDGEPGGGKPTPGGQDDPEVEDVGAAPEPAAAPPRKVAAAPRDTAQYPEWDWKAGSYRPAAAHVRLLPPRDGEGEWPAAVLRHYAATVRRLREKFERLRARRLRLNRQRDGDELDLTAVVSALADLRAGRAVDDRLYAATRPARRGVAILLLVDISGSTTEEVAPGMRIIDLEKVALLLTAQALDALGDPYAVLTFSGKGPEDVRMRTVKDFAERNGEAVRQRMGALQPEGYTRMGAAVRHATALLARPDAGHRLLLILSDGRPNDVDDYEGRYGIEDSRQAIAEARRAGVFPFCLTVDRKASAYLPRIFGTAGHEILRKPEQLPFALSNLVQHLLRS